MLTAALLSVALVGPTPTAVTNDDPHALAQQVASAPDPAAAYAALSPAQRAAYDDYTRVARVEADISTVDAPEVRGKTCRLSKARHRLLANGGNTLGTYWTTLHWCHEPRKGFSDTYIHAPGTGGETKTPGWTYKGVIDSRAGIVGTSRGYAEHSFAFVLGANPTPCLRVYIDNGLKAHWDDLCTLG